MGMIARQQWEKEQRRASILRAAEKVFSAKSAALVTMDDIAHEANLGKGTLYLYFDSKDELYLEVANRTLEELTGLLANVAQHGDTGCRRLETMLTTVADFALNNRDRFRVAISWMNSATGTAAASGSAGERLAEYRRLFGRLYDQLSEAVEAGKADGSLESNRGTPELVTELLGGVFGALLVELNAANVVQRIPAIQHLEGLSGAIVHLLLTGVRSEKNEAPETRWSSAPSPFGEQQQQQQQQHTEEPDDHVRAAE